MKQKANKPRPEPQAGRPDFRAAPEPGTGAETQAGPGPEGYFGTKCPKV